jgi:hypothetical protein
MFIRPNTLGSEVTGTKSWDLIDNFFSAFNISFIPREENTMADSLAISMRQFKIPLPPKLRYDIEVKYRPSIPDNVKHWKVFEDDLEVKSVNSNLVQYLLQTDIQKRTEKMQWQIQTLHRDFSPGNPNRENQHILY